MICNEGITLTKNDIRLAKSAVCFYQVSYLNEICPIYFQRNNKRWEAISKTDYCIKCFGSKFLKQIYSMECFFQLINEDLDAGKDIALLVDPE